MLPSLAVRAGSSVEWTLIAILFIASVAAGLGTRLAERPHVRLAGMLAAYLCGALALLLGGHALFGAAPFLVSPYAGTLVVSVLVAWALVVPRLRSIGLPLRLVFYMIFGCLVLGVAGSRLANALSQLAYGDQVSDFAAQLTDRQSGGLGVFGAFVVDALYLVLLFRRFPEHSLARALDASTTGTGVNIAIGRIGCLLGGCCFGAVTEPGLLTLSSHSFQPGSPAGLVYPGAHAVAIWATQPMEAVAVLGITLGCEALYRARARLGLRDGTVIAAGAGAYGVIRALLETLRADSPRVIAHTLTLWQALGVTLSAGALVWVFFPRRSFGRA